MSLQDRFPAIAELMHGIPTDKTLAFVDLWGTTAQIDKYTQSGDILDIGNMTQIQGRFSSILATIAKNNPSFEVIQASDGAMIVAEDPNVLLEQVQIMFVYLSISAGRFQFIPLRAALSKGVHGIHKNTGNLKGITNFQFLPYLGSAFVKVAKMEKSWPKGMRIFVTEAVKNSLSAQAGFMLGDEPVETVKVIAHGEEPFFEVNWLGQMGPNNLPIFRAQVGAEFLSRARVWTDKGDRYQKELGQSILDYGAWALTNTYLRPERAWLDRLKLKEWQIIFS